MRFRALELWLYSAVVYYCSWSTASTAGENSKWEMFIRSAVPSGTNAIMCVSSGSLLLSLRLCRDWLPSSSYPGRGQPPGGPRVGHTDPVRRSGLPHHRHHCGEAHVQQRQLQPAEDHPGGYNHKQLMHPKQKINKMQIV